MEKIAEDSRGNALFVEINEIGGRRYWSDEISCGVVVYDTALVNIEMLEMAIAYEKAELAKTEMAGIAQEMGDY